VLEAVQLRLDRTPDAMTVRRRTVEHVFGTFKHWMGYTHFLTRKLANVGTEMSLHVLAYNLTRVLRILGFSRPMKAMRLVREHPLGPRHRAGTTARQASEPFCRSSSPN
jgi:hypothetical protein